eukprot:1147610-Pelagomonas_calceolata.AAC.4
MVNEAQRTQDKVHAAQGSLRDARELEGLQSSMADEQARIIKPDELQTMLKQQDGFQKETLKLVHTAAADPGPSAPSVPTADPSSEDESEQEDKKVSSAEGFKMTKPAAFSGEEDVDEALFTLTLSQLAVTACNGPKWF